MATKINNTKTEALLAKKAELETKNATESHHYRHIVEELARRGK